MIWTNPWAWLGLAAIAVPILIHLLARETSTPIPFPTLRFLRGATLVDVRRKRLTDFVLLAVRCAILALAAAALAQPFIASRGSSDPPRLVLVDASPSVDADAARTAAQTYAGESTSAQVTEHGSLRDGLREAAGWAAAHATAAHIVIVSDFQRGAIDADALAVLPPDAGVKLHRVARRDVEAPLAGVTRLDTQDARTTAAWADTDAADDAIGVETAQADAVNRAVAAAARATATAHGTALRPATFVLSDAPNRSALADESEPANAPWMYDVMAAIAPGRAQTIKQIDGRAIVFLATADPAAAADAIREALPALASGPALSEREPMALSDDELRRLEREPRAAAPVRQPETWAGRWFWLAALALLALEQFLRRGGAIRDEELARAA